jgi:cytochrome P450
MDGTLFHQVLTMDHRANPYPLYAKLRAQPISRQDDGTFVVSTYEAVSALLHDPRLTSDDRRCPGTAMASGYGAAEGTDLPFLFLDPPEHGRLRQVAMRFFGPPVRPWRLQELEQRIRSIVDDLISVLPPTGQFDVVSHLSYPLPVKVICELMGVPHEDEPRFHKWADALGGTLDPPISVDPERDLGTAVAHLDLAFYMGDLLGKRHTRPADDLLSELIANRSPGGRMSDTEAIHTAILLLVAGHETTVNLISNGVLMLMRRPDIAERLRREPHLMMGAVEELVRYDPPIQFRTRRAFHDVTLGDTYIPAGSNVVLLLAAGNRDPQHFPQPDEFQPDRTLHSHLGFGSGLHYCFGAPLARIEAQVALGELLRRVRSPRLLSDPPPYRDNAALRGPRQLLLQYDGLDP